MSAKHEPSSNKGTVPAQVLKAAPSHEVTSDMAKTASIPEAFYHSNFFKAGVIVVCAVFFSLLFTKWRIIKKNKKTRR